MKLLEATNLSHSFDYPLFENISLDLSIGESVAIVGVSGSGKSTLMHILSTLLEPKTGTVKIMNEDIYAMGEKKLLELRRYHLGLIYQSHYLFRGFSGYENLEVAALLAEKKIDDTLLQKLKIKKVIEQKTSELSGGQQQRLSIARVLTKEPKIIFADEPTGNLDRATADEVMELFLEYIKEHSGALVLVTHDESLAAKCDKIIRM